MQNFIVLGQIPGTQLQITFLIWIAGALFVVLTVGLWLLRRAHLLRNYLIASLLFWTIRRSSQA